LRAKGFVHKEEPAVAVPAWKRAAVEVLGGSIPPSRPKRVWWESKDGFQIAFCEREEHKDVRGDWRWGLAKDGMSVSWMPNLWQGWYALAKGQGANERARALWDELVDELVPTPAPVPTPERVVRVNLPNGLREWGYNEGNYGWEQPWRFLSEAAEVLATAEEAIVRQQEEWSTTEE
jgi:hypothetical protein